MAHIPSAPTTALSLLTFREALAAANTPSPEYDIEKWLYAPNFYSEYRYLLGTRGKNPLICIGINPSTAKPDALDNTLKSVERIALGNGYDSFLMFNVYAQRATRPDDMERVCNSALHEENRKAFRYLLSLSETPPSGRPGEPSLKSGNIYPTASGTWSPPGRNSAPAGTAPGPLQKRGTPTTPCICARMKSYAPLT